MTQENPNSQASKLIHVHVCVNCNSLFRRETFEGRALTSGIFHCSACGFEGPLNMEMRTVQELSNEPKMINRRVSR